MNHSPTFPDLSPRVDVTAFVPELLPPASELCEYRTRMSKDHSVLTEFAGNGWQSPKSKMKGVDEERRGELRQQ